MGKQRREELDIAKGLAIFLVVLGHLVTGRNPDGNSWYVVLQALIYEFHMPFFIILSGAVFQLTFRADGFSAGWAFILSRTRRLLPAFVIFSILIWAGKNVASQFLAVDNASTSEWGELLEIYLSPTTSVARSLWYIYVLLELYALFTIALTAASGRLWPAMALAVIMRGAYQFADIPTTLGATALCEYAIFFAIGAAFGRSYEVSMQVFRQNALLWYAIFAASFIAMLVLPHPWSKGLIGLASLPAGMAFAASFTSARDKGALMLLGQYTFTIYLMNTLLIGLFKGVMLKYLPWDNRGFLLHFVVLLAAGLLGPIAIHRLLLARLPPLARITK